MQSPPRGSATTLFVRISQRIARRRFKDAKERVDILQAELGLIYGHTAKLALGFTVHLIAWIGTGVAGWIAYRVLGVPIAFDDAVAIESLLSAGTAAAFLVPMDTGVQEAGYAGLGAIFGIPPDLSLSVSWLRRARCCGWRPDLADLAVDGGAPTPSQAIIGAGKVQPYRWPGVLLVFGCKPLHEP